MRLVESLSESDMVASFLRAEIASERFGGEILAILERDRRDRSVIDKPDLGNEGENRYRVQLLGEFRGYNRDRSLFENFPADVGWHRAGLSPEELAQVRYIDYSYWNELSGGTRLPVDAAKKIRAGVEIYGVSNTRILRMADALRSGAAFPELILVGTAPGSDLVVLEGHRRLTAYALVPEAIPQGLTAIVGFSPELKAWMAL